MSITVSLKKRDNGNNLIIPLNELQIMFDQGANEDAIKQRLYDDFHAYAQYEVGYIHDRTHLQMVCNWVPKGGTPLNRMEDWLRLARKVNNLKDSDTELNLSVKQSRMIWDRMMGNDFSVIKPDPAFYNFVIDYMELIGEKSFPKPVEVNDAQV